jgi:serine/threonine protein kinase
MSLLHCTDPEQYLGQFIHDEYFIDRLAGRGAFACVFHAQRTDRSSAAIKILHTDEPLAHLRFIREIKIMQALPPSPHLVRYLGHGTLPLGGAYLAMEHVEGPTLREKMREGILDPEEACIVAHQIGLALQPLHRYGIVHRDLKPGNVLIAPDGTVKLFDFGLVLDSEGFLKLFEEEDILKGRAFAEDVEKGIIVGTPEYMALEQFEDARRSDPRARQTCPASDIFSLGVILYRLITGEYPYPLFVHGERPTREEYLDYFRYRSTVSVDDVPRPHEVDDALWSIISRAIRDPVGERQIDGKGLAQEISDYLSRGVGTQPVTGASTHEIPIETLRQLADEADDAVPFVDDVYTDELSVSSVWPEIASTSRIRVEPSPDVIEDDPTHEIELSDSLVIETKPIDDESRRGDDERPDR